MDIREELKSAGVYPSGPVSAWPEERNAELMKLLSPAEAPKVKASGGQMVKGLAQNVGRAIFNGKVTKAIRDERYDTCKACPAFIEKSKRCSECGCFMEAKTWLSGDKSMLCPLNKWSK